MGINERIKNFRNRLHLSHEYVANFLGINRATYTQMENGKRKITAEDISRLSELFGVTADALLNENKISQPSTVFARSFEKLDENDQAEIMNLIKFKEQMKSTLIISLFTPSIRKYPILQGIPRLSLNIYL